jgi:hypothetical protein
MRAALLGIVVLLALAVPAAAQQDRVQLGEALGTTILRANLPISPMPAPASPPTADRLSITDQLSIQKKGE